MKALRALGIHIFAGGFSIGVERAGFRLLGHLERTQLGVASWRRYRPKVPVHVDRKAAWSEAIDRHRGGVDLLYANPPCSPWSQASIGAGHSAKSGKPAPRGAASPLMDWTRDVVRVGAEVGAKVVVIESVRGALRNGAAFYDGLWREHRGRWPAFFWALVNPVDHGVPQERPRVFAVYAPELFRPEFRPSPPPSVLDAIAGAPPCPPMTPAQLYCPGHGVTREDIFACISLLEPGRSFTDLDVRRVAKAAPALAPLIAKIWYPAHLPHKLRVERPCPVVFGHAKFVHPAEPRLLTLRELMRLTGYPDDFEFATRQPMGELGKTVCPPAGEWIAREVAAYLRGRRRALGPGTAVYDCSTSPRRGGPGRVGPGLRQLGLNDLRGEGTN